jgi:hypothetical protein
VGTSPARGPRRRRALAWSGAVLLSLTVVGGVREAAPQSSTSAKKAAEKDYALIYGTVWGPDNQAVAGVPIRIRRVSDKKPKWELVSDRRGEFAQRVPVGKQDYIVQAEIKTSKGQPKPEVTVHIDDNERKDIGIHLSK